MFQLTKLTSKKSEIDNPHGRYGHALVISRCKCKPLYMHNMGQIIQNMGQIVQITTKKLVIIPGTLYIFAAN